MVRAGPHGWQEVSPLPGGPRGWLTAERQGRCWTHKSHKSFSDPSIWIDPQQHRFYHPVLSGTRLRVNTDCVCIHIVFRFQTLLPAVFVAGAFIVFNFQSSCISSHRAPVSWRYPSPSMSRTQRDVPASLIRSVGR